MFSQQVFAIRNDLVVRPIQQGARICWVVKDPVSRKFFYFNEQEYAILNWLDGTCPVHQVLSRFCRKFTPVHLSPVQLSGFLAELARADLLQGRSGTLPRGKTSSLAHRLGHVVGNPLAIRLPGINPSRFLDAVIPWCRGIFSPLSLTLAALLILTALVCAVVHFDDLIASIPHLRAAGTSRVLGITAIALIVSKIIHELAHALTARHFGIRCESMGILLLIFTPCLYCDVSDAWLLTSRRARVAISAAGIIAELLLASIAMLLWMVSQDPPTRAVLFTVMIVCSANTLLFNGNPLMRYDGYFILSDLLEMPNLAGESIARITSRIREWIWGERSFLHHEGTASDRFILWSYGLLSTIYRLFLLTAILYGISASLDHHGLGVIGEGLALLVIGSLLAKTTTMLLRPPAGMMLFGARFQRPAMAAGFLLAVLMGMALFPVPRRLDAPFRMESRQSRDIFVPMGGRLVWAVRPGETVRPGDRIAELNNPALDLELQKIDSQIASLQSRLHSLEARRGMLDDVDERPTLKESITGLEKKRAVLAREIRELIVTSPLTGVIHEPPNVVAEPPDPRSVHFWTGTPLDPRNRGCFLLPGTQICSITGKSDQRAVLYLDQKRVRLVRPGQSVRLWWPGSPAGRLQATVIEVAPAPVDEIPREFLAKNVIAFSPASTPAKPVPQEPMYRVTAKMTALNSSQSLPLRATGHAAIRGDSITVWKLFREFLRNSMN